jgi:outer membrane protein assembly factor BamB
LDLNKKIFEYNFYKKNFKKFSKEISFLINNDILYVSDNLGYLYAFNLDDKSLVWAKNYGIPFRSNLKFANNEIFLANQDNVIYAIDPVTGNKKWQFSTSATFLKSDFENNFVLDLINKNLIFLNTSGELYSINFESQKINWVLNFKTTSLAGDTELFLSQPLIIKNDNLIVSTEKSLLSYNSLTGIRNWILSSEPIFKPIITSSYIYAILKNDLLICLDSTTGKVIWSKNIFKNVEYKKIQNKFGLIKDFKIVNGKINIYSKDGYLLTFNLRNGEYNSFTKISKRGINSKIIFLGDKMLLIDNSNKLLKFN